MMQKREVGMWKRLLALVIATMLSFTLSIPTLAANTSFSDVTANFGPVMLFRMLFPKASPMMAMPTVRSSPATALPMPTLRHTRPGRSMRTSTQRAPRAPWYKACPVV